MAVSQPRSAKAVSPVSNSLSAPVREADAARGRKGAAGAGGRISLFARDSFPARAGLLRRGGRGGGGVLPDLLQQAAEGAVLLPVLIHLLQKLEGAELSLLLLTEPVHQAFLPDVLGHTGNEGLGPVFLRLPVRLFVIHPVAVTGDDLLPPGLIALFALLLLIRGGAGSSAVP